MGSPISYPAARLVSDLHLRAERPDLTARFSAFLTDCATQKTPALFILGDLFEYWIGDDDLASPFNAQIIALLRKLSDSGTTIYFMHGNRDFLIGDDFARAAGVALLDDASVVTLAGTPTLLMHGDALCTDDTAYQNFRSKVRSASWQQTFLARSLAERRAEVETLRQESKDAIKRKSPVLMDVNAQAVADVLTRAGCDRLIHGHTHRPDRHALPNGAERWVLSDWETERGDFLHVDAMGIQRHSA